jgi:hypothetical protein
MQRQWQEGSFDRKAARRAGFHVTMAPNGELYLNASVLDAMGQPSHFVLMYDGLNHAIGVRPVNSSTPRATRAANRGRGGGRTLRAFRLCQEFGIKFETKVRFLRPRIEDRVLVLDLNYTDKNTRAWPRKDN